MCANNRNISILPAIFNEVSTMNFFVCSSCTLMTSLRSSFALR